MNKTGLLIKEILRQFKCHLAYTPDKTRTRKWIRETTEKLLDIDTAEKTVYDVVGAQFMRENAITFDALEFGFGWLYAVALIQKS